MNTQPPALMPEADRMREAFEKWLMSHKHILVLSALDRLPNGEYRSRQHEAAWMAWQAAHTDTAATIKGLEADRDKYKSLADYYELWEDRRHKQADTAEAKLAKARGALRKYIYETTHLSASEEDGSHWCKISFKCLSTARTTLTEIDEA